MANNHRNILFGGLRTSEDRMTAISDLFILFVALLVVIGSFSF